VSFGTARVTGERCEHTLGALRCVLDRGHDLWHVCTGASPDDAVALTGPSSTPTPEMRAQAAMLGNHDGPALMVRPSVPVSPSDTTIANLARAYGAAYAAWVRARRETPNDIVETTMDYVAAERALRAAVDPKALTEEETLP